MGIQRKKRVLLKICPSRFKNISTLDLRTILGIIHFVTEGGGILKNVGISVFSTDIDLLSGGIVGL